MTDFDVVRTHALTLLSRDEKGSVFEVATTQVAMNNRGMPARVSTQFADGIPAESETMPGKGSFKAGEIINQHILWAQETEDGTKRKRIATSIVADGAGGLAGVIDSTTNDKTASDGQSTAMPLVINVGEAKGQYMVFFPDGRIHLKTLHGSYPTTLDTIISLLARQE